MHVDPVQLTNRLRLVEITVDGSHPILPARREPHDTPVNDRDPNLFDAIIDEAAPSFFVLINRHRRQKPSINDALVADLPTTHPDLRQPPSISCLRQSNEHHATILANHASTTPCISSATTIPALTSRPPVRFKDTDLHQRCCAVGSNLLLHGGKVAAARRTTPCPARRRSVDSRTTSAYAEHRSR